MCIVYRNICRNRSWKEVRPIIFHRLLFTSQLIGSMPALFRISSFFKWTTQRIFKILLKHFCWNTSRSILLSSLFIFYVSQLYNKTGNTNALYSFIFVLLVLILEFYIRFSLVYGRLDFDSQLLLRSFIPPPSLQTFAPKYVNSLTSSISFPCNLILLFCVHPQYLRFILVYCQSYTSGHIIQPFRFVLNMLFSGEKQCYVVSNVQVVEFGSNFL